jgi:single-strand DNA-binding protein
MYQQITLVGNLGNDPELRTTPSGVPVCNFSLAVHRQWSNRDGEQAEKTTWFRVTVWQRQAETVARYLRKGSRVLVVGEVDDPSVYLTREGEPAATLEVTGRLIKFLSGNAGQERDGEDEESFEMAGAEIPF